MILDGNALEPRWWWWTRVIAAAFIVTGLHAGIVAYAYLMPPEEEVVEEAEGAFMLELAPLPVAVTADAADMPGPTAPVTQSQVDEKKPTEEMPEVTPPKEVPLPVADEPELAVPIQKPLEEVKEEKEEEEKPVEKVEVKEETKEERPETEEAKPQEAMINAGGPPAPSSTPAPRTAARRQGTTDRQSDESMSWAKSLMNHLSRHRRYPTAARDAGHQGAVQVRFTIDRQGQVLTAQIAKASRSTHLDAEALAMLKRASPLPRPPGEVAGETVELVMPIEFTIK